MGLVIYCFKIIGTDWYHISCASKKAPNLSSLVPPCDDVNVFVLFISGDTRLQSMGNSHELFCTFIHVQVLEIYLEFSIEKFEFQDFL